MNQEKFLQTLKTLKFPDVGKYSATDFDDYFAEPKLLPFLEYLGSLDEKNVLTPEELKEYNSISSEELLNLEKLLNEEKNINEEEVDEKSDEEDYLRDHLTFIEKRCKSLQEEKEKLKEHQSLLLEEKAKCQAANLKIRRLFDDYSMNKLPQIQTKLSSTIKTMSELISKLKLIIDTSVAADNVLPGLNMKDVEEYFEVEEKIIKQTHSHLLNNFQFLDDSMTTLNVPGLSTENILKEISYLKKALHVSKMSEYKSICDLKEKEITSKYVECSAGNLANISEISSSQLSSKLEEERNHNEKLRKKEAVLLSHLSEAVKDTIDAQCKEILIAHSNEILIHYKENLKKISFPLQQLTNQRARLELLKLYLYIFQTYLQDIKTTTQQISSFFESEEKSFEERKNNYKKFFNPTEEDNKYLSNDSVFFSAYKILNDVQQQEASNVLLSDIITGIKKLAKDKDILLSQKEERKDTIEKMEDKYSEIEKVIVHGREFKALMKSEKEFSDLINQMEVLLTEIHNKLLESEKIWSCNNKLLETKKNLKLGRSLFLYALLEREKFEDIIDKIKIAVDYEASSAVVT